MGKSFHCNWILPQNLFILATVSGPRPNRPSPPGPVNIQKTALKNFKSYTFHFRLGEGIWNKIHYFVTCIFRTNSYNNLKSPIVLGRKIQDWHTKYKVKLDMHIMRQDKRKLLLSMYMYDNNWLQDVRAHKTSWNPFKSERYFILYFKCKWKIILHFNKQQ